MKRLLSVCACALIASPAFGATLYVQDVASSGTIASDSAWNHYETTGVDTIADSGDEIRSFAMNPVTVSGGGWTIETINTHYGVVPAAFGSLPAPATPIPAYLHIVPAADLATYDPTAAGTISITRVFTPDLNGGATGAITFQADALGAGLGISIPDGDYFIGLTPVIDLPTTTFAPAWNSDGSGAVVYTDPSGVLSPATVFPGVDALAASALGVWEPIANDVNFNMHIFGTPEPTSLALIGLGGLAMLRRSRA